MLKHKKRQNDVSTLLQLTEEEIDKECIAILEKDRRLNEKYSHAEIVRRIESGELTITHFDSDISLDEYIRQVKDGTYAAT